MIRFVLGLFVFAVALCAYIVTRPVDDGRRTSQPTVADVPADVSRAGTDTTLAVPSAAALSDVATLPAATAPATMTTSAPLAITVANILIGLGLDPATLGPVAARADGQGSAFDALVLQALQARVENAEIAAQVTSAAQAGEIIIPDVLIRADRSIDTATLLAAVVKTASLAAGRAADTPVDLATHPALSWVANQAFYTVQPDDSLAAIALQFYGDSTLTDMLLVANARVLSRADLIAAGQQLAIPSL